MAESPSKQDSGSRMASAAPSAEPGNNDATSTGKSGSAAPAPSGSNNSASNGGGPSSPSENLSQAQTAAILSYFKKRGFKKGEDTLRAEIEALTNGASPAQARSSVDKRFGSPTINLFDLAVKSAPREPHSTSSAKDGGASSSSSSSNANAAQGSSANGSNTLSNLPAIEQAAVEALLLDPTDRARGFKKLRNWCDGSLDIYQSELRPLLLPLFIHGYLDLIEMGYGAAAAAFYTANATFFLPQYTVLLSTIRSISLPSHIANDSLAQRFRSERYVLKMTATVFSLLLGWLTDGGGPVGGAGAAEGVADEGRGDRDKRAREAMLRIINERCRVQVIEMQPQELTPAFLEEGTGLTGVGPSFSANIRSRRYPALQASVVSDKDAVQEYNSAAAGPRLKLGPTIPLSEKLQSEVEKEVRDLDRQEGLISKEEDVEHSKETEESSTGDVLQPTYADLPPQAPVYRTVDVQREVSRLRDARKALRFDLSLNTTTAGGALGATSQAPAFMSGVRDASFNALGEEGAHAARVTALPSVCAYTYHDAADGLACSQFSPDLSLMAAGFEESYVQVWSLKGEPLRRMKSTFSLSDIRDRKSLDRAREDSTLSTKKLIGHSGPVYGLSFDPVGGSASAPKHLLSASADSTVRLWSLDTFSALVSYRGHNQPIWDVEWSPLGIYFATASADRTARLWSTERVNPLRLYAGHLSDVDCLNFHPNSLYLATGSSDKTCRLWDVQRGACVRLFVGHQSAINCVKISPDGKYLASAGAGNAPSAAASGDDCSISIWDLGSGRRVKKMWGHSAPILSLDFSADGSLLVSSGADCQLRCWDVRSAGGPRRHESFATQKSTEASKTTAHSTKSTANGVDGTPQSVEMSIVNAVDDLQSSSDCVSTFVTKRTPLLDVHFTQRNLCVAAGAFDASLM